MGGFAKRCNSELTRVHVEHSDIALGVAAGAGHVVAENDLVGTYEKSK